MRGIDELGERLIGFITIYGGETSAEVEPPSHGIRRPAWFNPRGTTISDVNRIALEMRGRT